MAEMKTKRAAARQLNCIQTVWCRPKKRNAKWKIRENQENHAFFTILELEQMFGRCGTGISRRSGEEEGFRCLTVVHSFCEEIGLRGGRQKSGGQTRSVTNLVAGRSNPDWPEANCAQFILFCSAGCGPNLGNEGMSGEGFVNCFVAFGALLGNSWLRG
jgi:hypothetical protein